MKKTTPPASYYLRLLAIGVTTCVFCAVARYAGQEQKRANDYEDRAAYLAARMDQLYARIDESNARAAKDAQYIHDLEGKLNAYEARDAASQRPAIYDRPIIFSHSLYRPRPSHYDGVILPDIPFPAKTR